MSRKQPVNVRRRPQVRQGKSPHPSGGSVRENQREQEATEHPQPAGGAIRETIESIVIAFILAFLFRTFEAEAFVIPTGSMAPTLMGRHKDLNCPDCDYPFQVNASEEEGGGVLVAGSRCPMCRLLFDTRDVARYPSYKGDRILVEKITYRTGEPSRWDVAVFKYPQEAATNFIKRVVGLPGETIRLQHGRVYYRPPSAAGEDFVVARKSPEKILAMKQPVYDNDYVLPWMVERGWPLRWQGTDGAAHWQVSEDLRRFRTQGAAEQPVWLRYRHFVPSTDEREALAAGTLPAGYRPRPQLITDFNAYNTNVNGRGFHPSGHDRTRGLGVHWVGDLIVECTLTAESAAGEFLLELVKGGRRMECRIDLASGEAALAIEGLEGFHPRGTTPIRGPGSYRLRFANVDDQLTLWVDGRVVAFDQPPTFGPLGNHRPTAADLAPVGLGSQGAAVEVSSLRILRDIYYIAGRTSWPNDVIADYPRHDRPFTTLSEENLAAFFSDPTQWDIFDRLVASEYSLGEDQFFTLGDNSARSKDGRLWEQEHFVDRELLIGKALWLYWPHSWHRIPNTNIPFPYFPNFERMKLVR